MGLPLKIETLAMLWGYGGRTKQEELMPVVILLHESINGKSLTQSWENVEFYWSLSDWENWLESDSDSDSDK